MTAKHATERSDTYSVSIMAPPEFAWSVLANVADWPRFSPFALAVTRTSEATYTVAGPQGDVLLTSNFEKTLLLLDHTVTLSDRTEIFIPYRVTPNHLGSELIMTNFKSPGDTDDDYEEQLRWMRTELTGAKRYVEERYAAGDS